MAELHQRALDKKAELEAVVDEITVALTDAQDSLALRHDDPASLDRSEWESSTGANQHIELAAGELSSLRDAEAALRATIASGGTPADAGVLAPDLRDNVLAQAELRVELRLAQERRAQALALVDEIGGLRNRALAELGAADQRVAQGETDDAYTDSLVDALADPPLSTVAGDAAATLSGADHTAADARLAELLPSDLRTRASERLGEAATAVNEARMHEAAGAALVAPVDAATRPIDAPIDAALSGYLAARDAMAVFVATAVDRVVGASTTFAAVAGHPDLTPAQHAAVHDDVTAESRGAIVDEGDLAGALVDARAAQRDIEDAILAALIEDGDADPELHADVIAARAALADASIQDAIDGPAGDYDPTAASVWEADIPDTLWDMLHDYVRTENDLDAIEATTVATDLIAPLELAESTLRDALDARDDHVRTELRIGLHQAARRAATRAAERTESDRSIHYLRGDGSAGRTPSELVAPAT